MSNNRENPTHPFLLSTHDSEGGDYIRVYSFEHRCEFFLHKDTNIHMVSYFEAPPSLPKDWSEGYMVVTSVGQVGKPFFLPKKNAEWYCHACCEKVSCVDSYKSPSKCNECE